MTAGGGTDRIPSRHLLREDVDLDLTTDLFDHLSTMNDDPEQLRHRLRTTSDALERIDLNIALSRALCDTDAAGARELASKALRAARRRHDNRRIAASMVALAMCCNLLVEYQSGRDLLIEAVALYNELGDDESRSHALYHLGKAHHYLGEYAEASRNLDESLVLHRERGDRRMEGLTLTLKGLNYNRLGDYPRALETFMQSRELLDEAGDRSALAALYCNTGDVYRNLGEFDKALDHLQRSVSLADEVSNRRLMGVATLNIGLLYHARREFDLALDYLNQGDRLTRESGNLSGEIVARQKIGIVLMEKGEYDQALRHLHDALSMVRRVERHGFLYEILFFIGLASLGIGETTSALKYFDQALDGATASGDRRLESEIHRRLAEHYEAAGEGIQALKHFRISAAINDELLGREQQRSIAQLEMRVEIERAEREREILRLQKTQLELEMEHKQRELTAMALHLVEKNRFLDTLKQEISVAVDQVDAAVRPVMRGLARQVEGNIDTESDWRVFEEQFEKVHQGFIRRLSSEHPDLSPTELKVCALLKIGMSSKEIAEFLAASSRTVDNHRYRIRRKLALGEDVNLGSFLSAI